MASVEHRHCLPLIGVCLSRERHCLVSMFVELGSLDKYVHEHQADLNSLTMLSWAEQIADGMSYLEMRGIIHRYVFVLISGNKRTDYLCSSHCFKPLAIKLFTK
ncbi:unnamed protein product [Echinostoma caproni]|uniref:Protein kinase domain-containing protein n=1 Tax=Echinostoma caproni TaxID=27848 RepID=A0A183BF54_9TREM|nr:unnamed protein product [Echinostoma caproni]